MVSRIAMCYQDGKGRANRRITSSPHLSKFAKISKSQLSQNFLWVIHMYQYLQTIKRDNLTIIIKENKNKIKSTTLWRGQWLLQRKMYWICIQNAIKHILMYATRVLYSPQQYELILQIIIIKIQVSYRPVMFLTCTIHGWIHDKSL